MSRLIVLVAAVFAALGLLARGEAFAPHPWLLNAVQPRYFASGAAILAVPSAMPDISLSQTFSTEAFLTLYDTSASDATTTAGSTGEAMASTQKPLCGVYAVEDALERVMFVGTSTDMAADIRAHRQRRGPEVVARIRVQTFPGDATSSVAAAASYCEKLVKTLGTPVGNQPGSEWAVAAAAVAQGEGEAKEGDVTSPFDIGGAVVTTQAAGAMPDIQPAAGDALELTVDNVSRVLDEIRPYLQQDGGNVRVVGVDAATRDVHLELEGACGNCPSSTVTMKMGIERVLRENFADLGSVRAVDPPLDAAAASTAAQEAVVTALEQVEPAIRGMGGSVELLSVAAGTVTLAYKGPDKLKKGLQLVLADIAGVDAVQWQ